MVEKKTLKELLHEGQAVAPGIYDNISARTVELVGYNTAFLSSSGLALAYCGVPDLGLINEEEILWMISRVTDYVSIPVIAEIENGYSQNSLSMYRTVSRLLKAGAGAFIIDDTTSFRGSCFNGINEVVSKEEWLGKLKAAISAVEGSGATIIARTYAKDCIGINEAIERCQIANKIGVDVTCVHGLKTLEEAKEVSFEVEGIKMWDNLGVTNGVSDVEPTDIEKLGFGLITINYTIKGAMYGMLDFAKNNQRNGNTVYHDNHDFDGMLKGNDYHELFDFHKKWIPMEEEFYNVDEFCNKPNIVK